MAPTVRQQTRYLPSTEGSLPAIAVQFTCLVHSYMLWVGTTDEPPENVEKAVSQGNLCRDWACAMPPTAATGGISGTSLFRVSSSDIALGMAQRLAKRFKKQIFLSVDVPPTVMTTGQGPKLIMEMEKWVVVLLKEAEANGSES